MKYFILIELFFIMNYVISQNHFPNLPIGKFRIYTRAILKCNMPEKNNNFIFNYYLNKISANKTALRGNVTFKVPLDNSFTVNINMAIKDSIGGWKDNAHIFKYSGGCTSIKNIMNELWTSFTTAFGINKNCPINPGTYISKSNGMSLDMYRGIIVKEFFYGTYKWHIYFTDKNNNKNGCLIFVVELKRPWEIE